MLNKGIAKVERRLLTQPSVRRPSLNVAVAHRRQTPEEQRRFKAAFDVFLAELVRQHLDRVDRQ